MSWVRVSGDVFSESGNVFCEISVFRRGVTEVFALQRCYATYIYIR